MHTTTNGLISHIVYNGCHCLLSHFSISLFLLSCCHLAHLINLMCHMLTMACMNFEFSLIHWLLHYHWLREVKKLSWKLLQNFRYQNSLPWLPHPLAFSPLFVILLKSNVFDGCMSCRFCYTSWQWHAEISSHIFCHWSLKLEILIYLSHHMIPVKVKYFHKPTF